MKNQKTVGVFFGGISSEHEISVITGMYAVNLLRTAGYRAVPVYLPREGGMATSQSMRGVEDFKQPLREKSTPVALEGKNIVRTGKRRKVLYSLDCALNCCHGGMGEDGTLSALFVWNGIPNASPDTPVSAIFMNKEYSQIAAAGLGIPIARSFAVSEEEWRKNGTGVLARAEEFGYPVIVKPSRLGSSIGVTVAEDEARLKEAFELAFELDRGALVEEYFADKRDVNCAACRIGGEVSVSPCEEVFSAEKILTFAEKYEGSPAARPSAFPADLPEDTALKIREYTKTIYERFHVRGVVRADFLVAGDKAYFNELNTVPGSLAGYLFGGSLTAVRAFVCSLVEECLTRPERPKQTVQTGILNADIFSGGKSCKRR